MSGVRDTACQTASRIEVGLQLCRDWSKPPLRYVECGKKHIKKIHTYVTVYILIREKWFCIIPLIGSIFVWKTGKMFPFSYILFWLSHAFNSLQIFWQQKKQSCSKHPWRSWIQDDVWWNYGGIIWRHSTRIPFSDQDDPSLIFLTTKRVAHHWLLCCPSGRNLKTNGRKFHQWWIPFGRKEMQSPLGEIVSLWEKLVSSEGVGNAGVSVADSSNSKYP